MHLSDGAEPGSMDRYLQDKIDELVDRSRKLAKSTQDDKAEAALAKDMEACLEQVTLAAPVSKEDIKTLRETVFGPQTFCVTEVVPLFDSQRTGIVVRGNLRADRNVVFEALCSSLNQTFRGKYVGIMVADEQAERDVAAAEGGAGDAALRQSAPGPRVAFQIIPESQAEPPQHEGWTKALGLFSSMALTASCGHFAFMAGAGKLPQETLDYLTNPAGYVRLPDGALLPGMSEASAVAFFATVVPLAAFLATINGAHEMGHEIAALMRKVRLGPSFFIPSLDLGSFGAVRPFTSLLKSRQQLWDVAAAGPLAGLSLSLALLLMGVTQTQNGSAQDSLVPVPTTLFQGSLMLGSAAHALLGDEMLKASQVMLSPMLLAGWCGLVANALQLLPVGSLDGGRLVQAAWGRKALMVTSVLTYLGLGLGLLAGDVALPFGLFVFVCQRDAEAYIQDNVTPAGPAYQAATLVALLVAVLVLLPAAPEIMDLLGMGANLAFL